MCWTTTGLSRVTGYSGGKDYFDELLEGIREIRASERRFYQKITDIYALSADYDRNAPITNAFFATVQNKLHWAITGKTAKSSRKKRTLLRSPRSYKDVCIYDYIEHDHPQLARMREKRQRGYRAMGYQLRQHDQALTLSE